jgi:general stress protein 26
MFADFTERKGSRGWLKIISGFSLRGVPRNPPTSASGLSSCADFSILNATDRKISWVHREIKMNGLDGGKKETARRLARISAAREIMAQQKYCAIITMDESGRPQVRTMNPFPPEKDMTVWMATNSRSRKVREIRQNPNVCLYYADHQTATGCIAISGRAELIDDTAEKEKRKREYWAQAFPDWQYLILIKVVPESVDVLNYKREMVNDPITWRIPTVALGNLPAD